MACWGGFGAPVARAAFELDQHLVIVQGRADFGRADENIAAKPLARFPVLGSNKAVAVAMHRQAAHNKVAICGFGGEGITVASGEYQFAAGHHLRQLVFQLAALSAAQAQLANQLLVAGRAVWQLFQALLNQFFSDHHRPWERISFQMRRIFPQKSISSEDEIH